MSATKITNYIEVVGLVLIGFALENVINADGNVTSLLSKEIGLELAWNDNRFWFVSSVCALAALSLVVVENLNPDRSVANHKGDVTKKRKTGSGVPIGEILSRLLISTAIALHFMLPLALAVIYDEKTGASLLIGFVFVDLSIIIERLRLPER